MASPRTYQVQSYLGTVSSSICWVENTHELHTLSLSIPPSMAVLWNPSHYIPLSISLPLPPYRYPSLDIPLSVSVPQCPSLHIPPSGYLSGYRGTLVKAGAEGALRSLTSVLLPREVLLHPSPETFCKRLMTCWEDLYQVGQVWCLTTGTIPCNPWHCYMCKYYEVST